MNKKDKSIFKQAKRVVKNLEDNIYKGRVLIETLKENGIYAQNYPSLIQAIADNCPWLTRLGDDEYKKS
ncbi:MAG: hypothetical protein V1818_01735 [Candidatus Aenigmatarchaeota archaeon]